MITFKCKMCGGDLSFEPGASVAECPYCGTTQTLPKLDGDRRANLYDRANHFRRQNEYDKAMAIRCCKWSWCFPPVENRLFGVF